jgi:phage terminase small subunit
VAEKKDKAGTSKAAAAARRVEFAYAYMRFNRNGLRAAVSVGVPKASAHTQAYEWLKEPEVKAIIKVEEGRLRERFHVDIDKIVGEMAKLALFDPREVLNDQGALLPPGDWPDHAAMAISGIDTDEIKERNEEGASVVVGYTKKLRFWSKTSVLDNLLRHVGGYEKDHEQLGAAISKAIVVPAKEGER